MQMSSDATGLGITFSGVVLDAPDARVLADFYGRLLGWTIDDHDRGWSTIKDPAGGTQLSFQGEPNYRPPTWPTEPDSQQMMLHLDFNVDDLEAAHAHAVAVGAKLAPWQPQSHVRVYLDPVGHVFCIVN
jgi:predicted enzyme related to lactoylglutathione lyase